MPARLTPSVAGRFAGLAVRVDGEAVSDPNHAIAGPAKLSLGKKRHALLIRP